LCEDDLQLGIVIIKRKISLTSEPSKSIERKEKRITTIERLLFASITTVIEEFRYSISKVLQKEI
jgi:hypothetical protein